MGEIFERAIPAKALDWTGERLTTAVAGQVEFEHLHRYFLARNLCRGLDVLDVASGEGYGTALLAQVARSVIGVEISAEAVLHANRAYRAANLRFLAGDARRLPLEDASVDAVVSFETIEHFYEHDQFLTEVRRVLRPDGYFIVSSPERDVYSPSGSSANPYHVRELTKAELVALLRTSFAHVQLMAQRPMLGSAIVLEGVASRHALIFERRGPYHYEASAGLPRAVYFVAIASNHPNVNVSDSLYIETAEIGAVKTAESEMAAARQRFDAALAEARAEAASACSQRDLARTAARRAAAAAEGAWHSRVVELEQQVSAWQSRVVELEQQVSARQSQVVELEQQVSAQHSQVVELEQQVSAQHSRVVELELQAKEWQDRYQGLRGRLEAILRRFCILRTSRLFPAPMRRFVRERMLGPAH